LKTYRIIFVLLVLSFISCDLFTKPPETNAVARVNEMYLYKSDVSDLVPEDASKEDSTLIVTAYINRWARKKLLMDGALLNLPQNQQEDFLKLVEEYKNDLFTQAYLERLVRQNIDSTVTKEQAQAFYEVNKESFKLNDDILQFRYIALPKNAVNLDTINKRFNRFEIKDQRYLDSIAVQFKSFNLNDSIWVKQNVVMNRIPVINEENKKQLLKKSNSLRLQDSINLYLMHIKDVRFRSDYAPLKHVKSSIEKIVINKRKLELIKSLENDITKDAIKNNTFEIYN